MRDRISYSQLRRSLEAACDQVCDRHEPLVIERRRGGDVVLVAREDYSSLEETAYLLSSPENARRLLQAIRGRAEERSTFASIDESQIRSWSLEAKVSCIDREHRLVYRAEGDRLIALACRFHY